MTTSASRSMSFQQSPRQSPYSPFPLTKWDTRQRDLPSGPQEVSCLVKRGPKNEIL